MEENKGAQGTIRKYIGEVIIKDAEFNVFDIICESLIGKGIDVDAEPVRLKDSVPNSCNCKIKVYRR